MIRYNESGWLFQTSPNEVHELTEADINDLLLLAEEDDAWADRVRQEVIQRDQNFGKRKESRSDWLIDELRIMKTGGTVIQFPSSLRIITFPSKRHLFRGERKKYEACIPSLNRALLKYPDKRDKNLYAAVAHMRKWQFADLIWKLNIVPYWEAKISDVNYDALAQHYGFQTHLLDLTNDFRAALFFACCKYNPETDSFRPLSENECEYGYIFHSPDWRIDFMNGGGSSEFFIRHFSDNPRKKNYKMQNGDSDGVAFQIGFQPLYRCHCQNGYIFPMKDEPALEINPKFEKWRFKQTPGLSRMVFEMMDGGQKVFPNEGITEIRDVMDEIKQSTVFSIEQLQNAYDIDVTESFNSAEELRNAVEGLETKNGTIEIREEEVIPEIPKEKLDKVNAYYDKTDLWKQIGGMLHQKPDDEAYRKNRCIEIYGELI